MLRRWKVREELIHRLGTALQADPLWVGYWSEFRIARYNDLPKTTGDINSSPCRIRAVRDVISSRTTTH